VASPASRQIASIVSAFSKKPIGLVTALDPVLGYEACSRIARRALNERRMVADIVLGEGLLTETRLNELLRLEALTRPSRIAMAAATSPKLQPFVVSIISFNA
jgi:aspartate ammonia-lyase